MTTTTLSNMPQGCGCAACQSAAKAELSSNYTGSATATLAEATSLYSGYRWGSGTTGITLTYKFFTALPTYYSSSMDESHNFQTFNAQMKSAAERILDQVESFTNIQFVETSGSNNQLGFAQASLPTGVGAWAYYPSTHALGGDVWTNNNYSQTQTPTEGNYGFYTLMHEIGHALGLQHSFTAGLTGDEASSRYSVMAYDWSPFFASSYMVYDIAALQKIYGANMSYHTGADTYVTNSSLAYTIWDAGGTDTLDASAQNSAVTLDLREGEYSSVGMTRNIGIAYGAVIENATGGNGNDILIGNVANNILTGNGGNDTFIASKGMDTFLGGSGNDLAIFDIAISNFYMTLVDAVTVAIRDITGAYGTTTAQNVETFQFANVNYSFDALAAMTGTLGGVETLDTVSMSVLSSFKSGKKIKSVWTTVDSSLETVANYHGTDLKYGFSDNVLTTDRSNNSGHDSLTVSAVSGYEGYIKALSIVDVQNVEHLTFNQIGNLSLKDATATQNLTVHVNGGTSLELVTGLGHDVVEILSAATGRSGASYNISTGAGNDTIHVEGSSVKMGAYIYGGEGNDTISVTMSAGARIFGDAGDDTLTGSNGGDKIYGGEGNDTLNGGDGNDVIDGGNGNDVIYGGYGSDALVGGAGADLFVFNTLVDGQMDNVKDFNAAEDTIDISAILVGYDPLHDLINDFVVTTYNKKTKATYLQIDADGSDNGSHFINIGQINGLRGHTIDELVQDHHIVVA